MKQIRGTEYLSAWRHTVSALRLNSRHGVEHRDRAVQHPQAALHFGREIHVARRVNNVDLDDRASEQVVAADVIVMPRSCSCTIQSIVAVPSCTSPIL